MSLRIDFVRFFLAKQNFKFENIKNIYKFQGDPLVKCSEIDECLDERHTCDLVDYPWVCRNTDGAYSCGMRILHKIEFFLYNFF